MFFNESLRTFGFVCNTSNIAAILYLYAHVHNAQKCSSCILSGWKMNVLRVVFFRTNKMYFYHIYCLSVAHIMFWHCCAICIPHQLFILVQDEKNKVFCDTPLWHYVIYYYYYCVCPSVCLSDVIQTLPLHTCQPIQFTSIKFKKIIIWGRYSHTGKWIQ